MSFMLAAAIGFQNRKAMLRTTVKARKTPMKMAQARQARSAWSGPAATMSISRPAAQGRARSKPMATRVSTTEVQNRTGRRSQKAPMKPRTWRLDRVRSARSSVSS